MNDCLHMIGCSQCSGIRLDSCDVNGATLAYVYCFCGSGLWRWFWMANTWPSPDNTFGGVIVINFSRNSLVQKNVFRHNLHSLPSFSVVAIETGYRWYEKVNLKLIEADCLEQNQTVEWRKCHWFCICPWTLYASNQSQRKCEIRTRT